MTVAKEKKNLPAPKQNEPTIFQYGSNQLEAIIINNKPWVVAKDVCRALGLPQADKAVKRLDDDERVTVKLLRSGMNRECWLVNESGLYSLIMRSNKPEAKQFRKWVTNEVLPTLRKDGKFEVKKIKQGLPAARNHNRLTPERIISIMEDLVRIDDGELRERISAKLLNKEVRND